MGKKDLTGKDFFSDRKRFAELLNAILYQGKDIIRAEELEPVTRVYPSFSGKGEMGRDVFMRDKGKNICYGLELETESDYSMPERVMVYDACELEHQIKEISRRDEEKRPKGQDAEKLVYREKKSRMREKDFLLPVVTAVLYLGIEHWEGKQKLSELYRIPGEIQTLLGEALPDYEFPMAEADFIDPNSFRTDLKEFFQAMQCRKDKRKLRELLRTEHFRQLDEDTAWAIAVHLDRKRLAAKVNKEGIDMCPAWEELLRDEREEGIAEGIAKGIVKGESRGWKKGKKEERASIIRNMIREGMDHEMICRVTGCSQKELAFAMKG